MVKNRIVAIFGFIMKLLKLCFAKNLIFCLKISYLESFHQQKKTI